MCDIKKICSQKTCHLVGQEQDICNFGWLIKKEKKYKAECKNCSNKRNKLISEKNRKNSNRPNISIQIKKCANPDCQVKEDQYINPDDNLSDFGWYNFINDYNKKCKTCESNRTSAYNLLHKDERAEYAKIYKENNKEEIAIYNKQWAQENKEERDQYMKKYNEEYKEEIQEYNKIYVKEHAVELKQYREEHKEEMRLYSKKYYQENKTQIIYKCNEAEKIKRKNNPAYALRKDVSCAISAALKRNNSSKNGISCLKKIGYTIIELKDHIEKLFSHPDNLTSTGEIWMNENNRGPYNYETWNDNDPTTWKWQLDHIIPHSEFKYTNMDCQEFKNCWALSNLRPYSAKLNIIDGATKIRHNIKKGDLK